MCLCSPVHFSLRVSAVLPTIVPSLVESEVSWQSTGVHGQPKNWMQYSTSHLATMALLPSRNVFKNNLRTSNFLKNFSGGACPQTPLALHAYVCIYSTSDLHVTPLPPASKNFGYGPVVSGLIVDSNMHNLQLKWL